MIEVVPESPPVRVVLVDDHGIVRQGLRSVLEPHPGITVVGEACDAAGALSVVAAARPDIVLLDLKLSTGSEAEGLQVCQQLAERFPAVGVLVLTTFLDQRLVLEALQRGAKGYVLKDVDGVELARSIRAVSRGESAFDSHAAAMVVRTLNGSSAQPSSPRFTEREREVLALLGQGLSNASIGRRLYISETTVKFHVANIMRKLGVGRRTEVVYAASKMGLI